MKTAIIVFSGNCRTFIHCFDSTYSHVISQLFPKDINIFIYFYLKLTDPGPKGQEGWNFEYKEVDMNMLLDKINEIKTNHPTLHIEYKLLSGDEISNTELLAQVKDRKLYKDYYEKDSVLLRGMNCHYNLEKCGIYILEKESSNNFKFDYIVYLRPDLFFIKSCNNIETYNASIITLGEGPNHFNNDHIAIIPRDHFSTFFFDRMNVYRNNTQNQFGTPEAVYWHTITYEVKPIGNYFIKRS
jgi:hypothetical protein